jgi:hypothetical protein
MWAALRQLGDCGLAKRECCGRVPASILVHKHPHNCRSHDGSGYELGSGEAALRRSATANLVVGRQLRPWLTLRRTNIRTTAEATTTPASTVTQARRSAMWAALRQPGDCGLAKRECCGRAPASTLAHAQGHKHPHNRRSHDNASYHPGSGEAALRRFANRESCE